MPAVNGVHEPRQSPAAKRKRADTHPTQSPVNGITSTEADDAEVQETIVHIVQILKKHDTTPSILDHIPQLRENGSAPSPKRAKLSQPQQPESISSKLERRAFTSFDELVHDVEAAASSLLLLAKSKYGSADGTEKWTHAPKTLELDKFAANVAAFRSLLVHLMLREENRLQARSEHTQHMAADKGLPNGTTIIQEDDTTSKHSTRDPRTVLTLFGNAPSHRQLFSSFQRPIMGRTTSMSEADSPHVSSVRDSVVPIREGGLPNGIFSTKVIPEQNAVQPHKSPSTFREVFGMHPPATALLPPKTPKLASTGSTVLTWTRERRGTEPPRQRLYSVEKHSTSKWLGYGGVPPADETSTPAEKRKQRDRALSTGESRMLASDNARVARLHAAQDAIFRRAYSSFAPCRDNSFAVITDETKNQVWWEKVGSTLFEQTLVAEAASTNMGNPQKPGEDEAQNLDERILEEVVNSFEPLPDFIHAMEQNDAGEDDVDIALQTISELLEVLHSHQRIRLSSNAANNLRRFSEAGATPDLKGKWSSISKDEINTYTKLKAQLAWAVSRLPPYALSKLDGDQLADLQISPHFQMEAPAMRGTLEEDTYSKAAKQAAFNAAIGSSQQNRSNTIAYNAAARNSQVTPAMRPAQTQHYGSKTAIGRDTSTFKRDRLSNWQPQQTPAQTYIANAQRPAYPPLQRSYTPTAPSALGRPPSSTFLAQSPPSTHVNGLYSTPNNAAYQSNRKVGAGSPYQTNVSPTKPSSFMPPHVPNSHQKSIGEVRQLVSTSPAPLTSSQPHSPTTPAVQAPAPVLSPAATNMTFKPPAQAPVMQEQSSQSPNPEPQAIVG